ERLAAGEADLAGAEPAGLDLVEERRRLGRSDVDEPVVARARFDVAVLAGDVAERAGVDPKRLESLQRHGRTGLPGGRPIRVRKLARRALRLLQADVEAHGLFLPNLHMRKGAER